MQRDRPLQNSMFLPQPSGNNSRRPSAPIQYNFPLGNIKKVGPGYNNTQSHFQPHNYVVTQTTQTRQFHTQNSMDQINQAPRFNQGMIHQIFEKIEKLNRAVEKHQFQLSSLSLEGELSKRVMNQVKKNLPVFTGGNDVYDHIINMKVEIKNLQDELSKTPKLNDIDLVIKKQIQSSNKFGQSSATSSTSLSGSSAKPGQLDPVVTEALRKRDDFFQNIVNNLDTEISILKKNLSNMNMQMKVSPVTSSSCIVLKYQQLFKARTKAENDMVLSECTYYIDNEGHLLDCHSRYLVDQKGKKIKLQDKHLNLLRSQKILQ